MESIRNQNPADHKSQKRRTGALTLKKNDIFIGLKSKSFLNNLLISPEEFL